MGIYPPGLAKGPQLSAGEQLSIQDRGKPRIDLYNANSINE